MDGCCVLTPETMCGTVCKLSLVSSLPPPVCGGKLASGGYFMKQDTYYCSKDYHILFGTKCKKCGDFIEGRVVTALGHSYHPQCFTCNRCK